MPGHTDVMISSTSKDLPAHRAQAEAAIEQWGGYALVMENLPSSPNDAITASLKLVDEAEIYEEVYDNVSEEKPYDAMLGGWGLYGPEPDHYRNYLASPTSFFAFNNQEIIDLFAQGRSVTDEQARYDLYAEIDSLLWQDLPMIPLYQAVGAWAYRSDLNIDAAELNGSFLTGLKFPGRAYFMK